MTTAIESRTLRSGAGVAVAGLVFLLLGLLGVAGLVFLATRPVEGESATALRIALVAGTAFPLAFAALGFWLSFAGQRVTLDPHAGQVRIAYGLWWVWQREALPLADFRTISLTREVAQVGAGDGHTGNASHVVRLLADGRELELGQRGDYHAARRLAESLCQLCGLPLRDATAAETVERDADTLQESLGARARRLGHAADWPAVRASSRIEVLTEPGLTTLRLPRPDRKQMVQGAIGLIFLLAVYGGALFGLGFFVQGLLQGSALLAWMPVVWGLALLPVLSILLFGLFLLAVREEIAVSHRNLRRTWRLAGLRAQRDYAADVIEDLAGNDDEVLLRTDRRTLRIGFSLSRPESRWLGQALQHLLTHGPRPAAPGAGRHSEDRSGPQITRA